MRAVLASEGVRRCMSAIDMLLIRIPVAFAGLERPKGWKGGGLEVMMAVWLGLSAFPRAVKEN